MDGDFFNYKAPNPYLNWREMMQPMPELEPVPAQQSPLVGKDLTAEKPAENPSWLKQIGSYLAKPGTAVALAQAGKLVNDAGGVTGTPVRFNSAVLDVANSRAGMQGMQKGAVIPNTNRMVRPSATAPPVGTTAEETPEAKQTRLSGVNSGLDLWYKRLMGGGNGAF